MDMTTICTTLAFIGNFGGGEIIVIFLIVLLLFGAKIPVSFPRKGVNEFRKAKNDWEQDIQCDEPRAFRGPRLQGKPRPINPSH